MRKSILTVLFWILAALAGAGCSSSSDDPSVVDSASDSGSDSKSDSGDTLDTSGDEHDHLADVERIVALLPPKIRGVLAVDFEALFSSDASKAVVGLFEGDGLDPALTALFQKIERHSLDMDIARAVRTAVWAQSEDPARGAVLLSRMNFDSFDDIPGVLPVEFKETYRGREIRVEPSKGLSASVLPERLLVVGNHELVKAVIDAYEGDSAQGSASSIAPYLSDLLEDRPVTGVYGLPGMYKNVEADTTLAGAVALGVGLELSAETVSGEVTFYMSDAEQFVSTYNQAAKAHQSAPLVYVEPVDGKAAGVVIPLLDVPVRRGFGETIASRFEPKMLFHLMAAKEGIKGIASGQTLPWANFFVHDAPPSIFINWEIPQQNVEELSAEVLPKGFEMAKLRVLESDDPAYFLVLNVYRTEGIVSGVRFEWSVFVKDPVSGEPRFMVIEAMADSLSMDPVNLMTAGEPVTHVHDGDVLSSEAEKKTGAGKEPYFACRINWPQAEPIFASSAREFVSANDFIFWGGGVADRGMYSSSVYNRAVVVIPPGEYEIVDDTPWARFIDPQPRSVYGYQNELDIVVAMWSNLDAPYLDMTEARRSLLKATRNPVVKGMIEANVTQAFAGKENVIATVEIEDATPSLYVNYLVDPSRVSDFEAALGLPEGYRLTKTRILEGDSDEAFYLTLAVFESKGALEGTRAEWWVYVDDGGGRARVMIVELLTEDAALEPVALLNFPAVVEHDLDAGELRTRLSSQRVEFGATLPMEAGVESMHALDWVEAQETVCYVNGVCDKFYVDGKTLTEPPLAFEPAALEVESSTPWDAFIESEPLSILVRTGGRLMAKKPWHNVMPN